MITNIGTYSEMIGKIIVALENERVSRLEGQKERSFSILNVLIFFILYALLIPFFWHVFVWITSSLHVSEGMSTLIICIVLISLLPGAAILSHKTKGIADKKYYSFIDRHYNLVASLEDINTIDDIINFINALILLLKEMRKQRVSEDTLLKEKEFLYLLIKDTSRILDREINEHITKLNIGKKMLNAVQGKELSALHLQQARLDKQIQQFEELQRVLVKI